MYLWVIIIKRELLQKIIEKYDQQEKRSNGKIKWGNPLCDLELCTTSISDNNIINIDNDNVEMKAKAIHKTDWCGHDNNDHTNDNQK